MAITRYNNVFDYSLDVVQSDGSEPAQLAHPDDFNALPHPENTLGTAPSQVSWIPNSHKIAFSTFITFEGPGSSNGDGLYVIDADNGEMEKLATIDSSWAWKFKFSPDGSKIAIGKPESLDIFNADGSLHLKNLLTFDFINTASEYAWTPDPQWSPDGSTLGVVIPPKEPWTENPADSLIALLAVDGKSKQTFSTQMTYFPGGFSSFSPDFKQLVYLTRDPTSADNIFFLRSMDLVQNQIIDYTSGKIYSKPVWSLDGSKFLYYDMDSGAYIGQPDLDPVPLSEMGEVTSMAWIDASRFIVSSRTDSGWKLLLGAANAPEIVIFSTSQTGDFPLVFTTNK